MANLTDEQLATQLQVARANDEKEQMRLKRNLKLVKKMDHRNTAIYAILESWLDREFTSDDNLMTAEDVENIAQQLPPLSNILIPGFFNRVTYPLRIFRQLLFLHDSNPVVSDFMNLFNLSPCEMKSSMLKEQLWFLLFLGAEVVEVDYVMAQHKKQKGQLNAMASTVISMTNGNSRLRNLRTPPVGGTLIGDVRQGLSVEDPIIDHARAFNNDSARAQYKQDARSVIKTEPTNRMVEPFPENVYTPSYLARAEGQREPSQRTSDNNSHERSSFQDPAYIQTNKGCTVESYFKEKKFTGSLTQSMDNLIRDFYICSVQQALNPSRMSLFSVNALADPARQYSLTHCSSNMSSQEIVTIMRRQYSSETRKLQIQSEMDSLDLSVYMHNNDIKNARIGLSRIIEPINSLDPQLPAGFGDDAHKNR